MHEITRTTTRTDRGAAGTAARRRSGGAGGRGGPPGRRDSRRPGVAPVRRPDSTPGGATALRPGPHTATRPNGGGGPARRAAAVSRTAALAAVQRERDRLPHYWFAHRLLLTLSGQRPVHTLLGHALPDAYDQLIALAPRAPLRPAAGCAAPVVRRCGEYRPRHGVIEAFARIASADRLSALAFRLELGADARWRCAAVDLGPLVT
ncbi:Rv3235 family protein [Streptomyces sp. RTd22]|uniref:Rv3235 family protein n=1 Tax=Streptomyces sp. RTd22 TaxID=1841249 RepID=UPI000AE24732|nr:Rv3235 family protein [Streptomyces sp. RTd22]